MGRPFTSHDVLGRLSWSHEIVAWGVESLVALGTPNMPLQASISVASPGGATAQSHTHIHSHHIDTIGPLCGGMRIRRRQYSAQSYPLGNEVISRQNTSLPLLTSRLEKQIGKMFLSV